MIQLGILVTLSGCLIGYGIWALACTFTPARPRLGDALALLNSGTAAPTNFDFIPGEGAGSLERIAIRAQRRLHLPIQSESARLLAIHGRSVADFLVAKLALALIGLVAPLLISLLGLVLGAGFGSAPAFLSVIGLLAGYFLPDLLLRRESKLVHNQAAEALSVFFDLVILERMANASAVQALSAAAELGDAGVFRSIRAALEQSRLQQRQPWAELRATAKELQLEELDDIAQIMSLDEQGAPLAETLRARVKELRNAQLNKEKTQAQSETEAMTIWMVIPVLVFALLFLIPPLMKLVME
jgi:hypothetical protein